MIKNYSRALNIKYIHPIDKIIDTTDLGLDRNSLKEIFRGIVNKYITLQNNKRNNPNTEILVTNSFISAFLFSEKTLTHPNKNVIAAVNPVIISIFVFFKLVISFFNLSISLFSSRNNISRFNACSSILYCDKLLDISS